MKEEQLERYCRHILLPEIDLPGQEKLLRSRILVIGMGGLGAPACMYLASSGVGHLIICDDDQVELNNIQRQIIYPTADIGRRKVEASRDTLLALNPDIHIETIDRRLNQSNLSEHVRLADVVIDASDNFETRFEVNAACVSEMTPLVSGAVTRLAGQVLVFRNNGPASPCYRCLYPEIFEGTQEDTCREAGVLAPVAGIIGTTVATEALRLLLNIGDLKVSYLSTLDALHMNWRKTRIMKDLECPVCSNTSPEHQKARNTVHPVSLA